MASKSNCKQLTDESRLGAESTCPLALTHGLHTAEAAGCGRQTSGTLHGRNAAVDLMSGEMMADRPSVVRFEDQNEGSSLGTWGC